MDEISKHPLSPKKVYGPYTRKDGRKHVCLILPCGKRKTVSYPKYIMESNLGRLLVEPETVDHIDRNFNNNDIKNLRVINRSEHCKGDARFRVKNVAICAFCSNEFEMTRYQMYDRKSVKSGPFCSKSCSSKANHISNSINGVEFISERNTEKLYYFKDKENEE